MSTITSCLYCPAPKAVKARGLCRRHYMRWWRHGHPLTKIPQRPDLCVLCPLPHSARGLCHPHYRQWLRVTRGRTKRLNFDQDFQALQAVVDAHPPRAVLSG